MLNLENLPEPILDDHPEWIELYHKAWEIAKTKVCYGTPENGLVDAWMDEAFDSNIYQWDICFIMMYGKYSNGEFPSVVSLENFYRKQKPNGYIGRMIRESDGSFYHSESNMNNTNPPMFSWAEWDHYLLTGDAKRFGKVINGQTILEHLANHFNWVKANKMYTDPVFGGLYKQTSDGNGLDNSPEWFYAMQDLTAQQAQNAYYIAKIGDLLGDEKTKLAFENEYKFHKNTVNNKCWSAKTKFYHSLKDNGIKAEDCKTILGWWPMAAGIASESQAADLVAHITNPNEFWRKNKIPSLSADHPKYDPIGDYWKGGIWPPTQYMTIHALKRYGYDNLAKKIAESHIQMMYRIYRNGFNGDHTIWECYAPESFRPSTKYGGQLVARDFMGWGGLGPIAMLIEDVIGIRTNAPDNELFWNLRLKGRNGIKNFHWGNHIVSLMATPSSKVSGFAEITVKTNSPFLLKVQIGSYIYNHAVFPGTKTLTLGYGNSGSLGSLGKAMISEKQMV